MDSHIDTSWCPVCDRQISPKRHQVPVTPHPAPPPPPSSPQSSPQKTGGSHSSRRLKSGTKNLGLLHGTGRLKPNGALKRSNSSTATTKSHSATAPLPVTSVVKLKTVIDQAPTPLYCSEECRLADINIANGLISDDYNPERDSPPLPRVPHNSFSLSSESGSDSSGRASSLESRLSLSESSTSNASCSSDFYHQQYSSQSMAIIAAMYHFPPLPPPPPSLSSASSTCSRSDPVKDFQSGNRMDSRYINDVFRPDAPKRSGNSNAIKDTMRIPDESAAWRASVYSFSAPTDAVSDPVHREMAKKAYGSFVASPHRSRGETTLTRPSPSPSYATTPGMSSTEELSAQFSASFARRCESRTTLYPSTAGSCPSSSPSAPRRERSLLQPGTEGKLLVPDVKLKSRNVSSASLSSWAASSYPSSSRYNVRTTSRPDENDSRDLVEARNAAFSAPSAPVRPAVSTRSWSYDNFKTYPIMQLPPKKEKRIEVQVVDGVEKEVEVEVEIVPPRKRLFLFAEKEISPSHR